MSIKESSPFFLTKNKYALNQLQCIYVQSDQSCINSPTSKRYFKINQIESVEQLVNNPSSTISSQSLIDSLAEQKYKNNSISYKKQEDQLQNNDKELFKNPMNNCNSYLIDKQDDSNSQLESNMNIQNNLSKSLSSASLLSLRSNARKQKKFQTQSVSYNKENPFMAYYDDQEKKEFFRSIKFNQPMKKRGLNNKSASSNTLKQSSNIFKNYLQDINEEHKLDLKIQKIQQNNSIPNISSSPTCKSEMMLIPDQPYFIQQSTKNIIKQKNLNLQPSQNIKRNQFSQIENNSNSQLNKFLSPHSKNFHNKNKSYKFLSSFSESLKMIFPQQIQTPLSTKEKKQNDRIKKIMNFSLAKEINSIISTMKKEKLKECNPSILKLPPIKLGTNQYVQSDNQLVEKENKFLECKKGKTQTWNEDSSLQFNQNNSDLNQTINFTLTTKKKQVHFIIHSNQGELPNQFSHQQKRLKL